MSVFICQSCVASRQTLRSPFFQSRAVSILRLPTKKNPNPNEPTDIDALLSEPTWAVRDLITKKLKRENVPKIKPKHLHHLLRLSALPLPETPEEEKKLQDAIQQQLRFVKKMQKVDTEGVEPLQGIRDETSEGRMEATIGLEELRGALAMEDVRGR
ncbi:hypothetical protein LSUE1_G007475, partial [Lachnellula suecica]